MLVDNRSPNELLSVAVRHHRAGEIDAAEAAYRQILHIAPNHIDSLHLLGLISNQRGNHAAAIELIERAIALKPDVADFRVNCAAALKAAGRLEAAEAQCRQAIALSPALPKAHYALGATLQQQGRFEPALDAYRRTLELNPDHAEARSNLGSTLLELGRVDEAIVEYERGVAARPNSAHAHYNLGLARQEQGRPAEAITCYRQAIALKPDYADAYWNGALQHLALGEYPAGWNQYEWRWRRQGYPAQRFAERQWDGGNLTGRTILLSAEQGFGDTFQFIRYAALVKKKGGTVIVECQPELKQALAYTAGIDRLVGQGEAVPFDRHAAMLSLPRLLGTDIGSIPADIPYIRPDPMLATVWRAQIAKGPGLNAGLVWRGNPNNSADRKRSMTAEQVAPLCTVPGIGWFSLQVDASPAEIAALSRDGKVRDCGPQLTDWADTAALISRLDLVVTVDTAVAHLAGALGKPVWVMLATAPHWSWLREQADSPWYPTARLFRQNRQGDWGSVLRAVGQALRATAKGPPE